MASRRVESAPMTEDWAWLNGQWVPAQQVAIPVWDAGFVYAATVTDLCRTIGHRLFRWPEHLRRFLASAELCEVPIHYSEAELTQVAEALVTRQIRQLSPWEDLAVVLFATPGPVAQYRPMSMTSQENPGSAYPEVVPTLGLHTFRLPLSRYARLWREGFRLASVPLALPDRLLPRSAKHRSRLHWWRGQRQIERQSPGTIAVFCENDGALLETAFANLVVVLGDTLATPPQERVLNGISLQVVRELARQIGRGIEERLLYRADLERATEAFLTSSSFCLLPVREIDGKVFPCPGPIAGQLLRAWSDLVGYDLLAQLSVHDR